MITLLWLQNKQLFEFVSAYLNVLTYLNLTLRYTIENIKKNSFKGFYDVKLSL